MTSSGLPLILIFILLAKTALALDVRIKDITTVKGNRHNGLSGIGIVAGLSATGDSPISVTTSKMMANMLTELGMQTTPEQVLTKSLAAVLVTAELPAFAKNGSKLDVKISTLGDAISLAGGTLVATRLLAGDGLLYAVASGQIVTAHNGGQGAKTFTVANIPGGAFVEREFVPSLLIDGKISLSLATSDFTTAYRISEAINRHFKGYYAQSIDAATVEVALAPLFKDRLVEFIAEIEALKVAKDTEAVVVLNERTGTVVLGFDVSIQPVVISHNDLTIQVGPDKKAKGHSMVQLEGSTVGDLVKSLNTMGVKPQDVIGIIQGIHASGALNAKLKML